MCLPSWLYRSLHSGRVMGHGFVSFAANLSFQNYCLKIRIGVKKKNVRRIFAPISYVRIGRSLGKRLLLHGIRANLVSTLARSLGVDSSLNFLSEKCIFCILCLVPFFWQFRKLHRRPSIYQCVCHRMTLLDFISIHEWKKRIVANRCVGVDLVLPNF